MIKVRFAGVLFAVAALSSAGTFAVLRVLQHSIAEELPPGYRLVALEVAASEARVIRSKDRIDVLITMPEKKRTASPERTAQTILQNVLVFKVDIMNNERGVVYVGLNPYEAQFAVLEDLAQRFHITLRPRGETAVKPMETVGARKLFR